MATSKVKKTKSNKSSERLSGWDFATWRSATEDQMLRSTMTALYMLDRAPDWDRLVDRYDRASRLIPILRKKVIEGPVAIANPRLVVDENFDLSFHMRRFTMPAGSTFDDVLEDARRQSMTDFDRDRSLWKVTVLEGLPGGRAAMIFKLHHAIADGQGALQLGAALVDLDAVGMDQGPMPAAPEASDLSARDFGRTMVKENAAWVASAATDVVKGAVPTAVSAVKAPKETVSKVVKTAQSLIKYAQVASEPASPIMSGRSVNYHFAAFEFPFENIRGKAKENGHTANDVFLASIASGMELYHRKHNAPVDALHIGMPISTRKAPGDSGNAVGIAHFDLPLNEPDADKLMDHLHEVVAEWRAEPVIGFSDPLGELSRFIPTGMVVSAANANDLTASNVPGPPFELWLAGAKIEHVVPLPPLIGAGVFVAMLTYNKVACIGLAIDDAAAPDRDVLIDCMAEGFAQVTGKPVKLGGFDVVAKVPAQKSKPKSATKTTA